MSRSRLSRRAVLSIGAMVATVSLAGCQFDPSPASAPAPSPGVDPDVHVVDAARAELSGLVARLRATSGTAALVACHRAQLAALGGHPPPITQRSAPLTPAQVVARERRAADRFTGWAASSANGDLARVLASIAAGIRMQPVVRTAAS
jgi:hypothetical protein